MTNKNIIRLLNVIAVIAATTGGASAIPNLDIPKQVLAAGLFVAMLCKAIAAELTQVRGESDEVQGIALPTTTTFIAPTIKESTTIPSITSTKV